MTDEIIMYPKCNPEEFPELFTAHMSAMTTEKLESKSAIAAQLAYRDHQIQTLLKTAAILAGVAETYHKRLFANGEGNATRSV